MPTQSSRAVIDSVTRATPIATLLISTIAALASILATPPGQTPSGRGSSARADEPAPRASDAPAPHSLSLAPAETQLRGPRAYQRLLATAHFADGRMADFSRVVKYEVAETAIATVDAAGVVTPKADGQTTVTVRWRDMSAQAKVVVSGMSEPAPIDFRTEVIAALSRAGCNQGACHGSPQGKDGFRLSLRGFDPDLDLQTLSRDDGARRVNPFQPETSLILQKGLGRVPHQGGKRIATDDAVHRTLRGWIAEGCAASPKDSRQLETIEILPSSRALASGHPEQQLAVVARYSDGTTADVSRLAVFSTRLDPCVDVSLDGLVRFQRTGEATILVRYLQQVRSVHLTYVERDPAYAFRGPAATNVVDKHVFQKQQELQLNPAPLADDATFLRRVYLDTIATLPTAAEALPPLIR